MCQLEKQKYDIKTEKEIKILDFELIVVILWEGFPLEIFQTKNFSSLKGEIGVTCVCGGGVGVGGGETNILCHI